MPDFVQPPFLTAPQSFTRPANTTAYAFGQLVANSTTAASVTPLAITGAARAAGQGSSVLRCRLIKGGSTVSNAIFRVHLYTAAPTASNGDGAAWLSNQSANYVGSMDVTVDKAMNDGSVGIGVPANGSQINFVPSTATNLYALIEARAAYTPISGETFSLALEVQ